MSDHAKRNNEARRHGEDDDGRDKADAADRHAVCLGVRGRLGSDTVSQKNVALCRAARQHD